MSDPDGRDKGEPACVRCEHAQILHRSGEGKCRAVRCRCLLYLKPRALPRPSRRAIVMGLSEAMQREHSRVIRDRMSSGGVGRREGKGRSGRTNKGNRRGSGGKGY